MATRLLIDGYNLVARLWGMGRGGEELARQRARLIDLLSRYRAARGHAVEVVFDGWKEGDLLGSRDREQGIDITFSRRGVTADELLRELAREADGETIVVSGDRRVQNWARDAGAEALDVGLFVHKLRELDTAPEAGVPDATDRDEDDRGWTGNTVKKGNPRRPSKRERARQRRLDKL